jgi:hypothetical protein
MEVGGEGHLMHRIGTKKTLGPRVLVMIMSRGRHTLLRSLN